MINYGHQVAVQVHVLLVLVVLVLYGVEDGNRTAQVVARRFLCKFIGFNIWGVVRGARDLEEDPVDDVLGALCRLSARVRWGVREQG